MTEVQHEVQAENVGEIAEVAEAAEQIDNTEPAAQRLGSNKEIIAYLAEKFPLCFSLEGEAKPLKIGLFQELAEVLKDDEKVSKTQLRHALRQYTSNWRYLHGCRLGAERVDLQGNPAGVLEQEHADHAAQQLAEAKAKVAEKRAAERAAAKAKKQPARKPAAKKFQGERKGDKTRSDKPVRSPKPQADLKALDFSAVTKGQVVKVKVAERVQKATVLETHKDEARVQLDNGLVINIAADRLFA